MFGQHEGLGRAVFEQPLGRQAMAKRAIFVGQHGVGRFANQGVGKSEGRAAVRGDGRSRQIHQLAIAQTL